MPEHEESKDESPTPITRTSERFGDSSVSDVTFISKDGVQFHIKRAYLEATCGAFPPPGIATNGELVPLEETAATLELLFQFTYPQRHPSLSPGFRMLDFAALAEAAEKYEVFSAIDKCYNRMLKQVEKWPALVLSYAARHGYTDLVDEAALLLVGRPVLDTVEQLPQNLVVPWVRYYEGWTKVLQSASTFNPASAGFDSSRRNDGELWKKNRYPDIIARCLGAKVSDPPSKTGDDK